MGFKALIKTFLGQFLETFFAIFWGILMVFFVKFWGIKILFLVMILSYLFLDAKEVSLSPRVLKLSRIFFVYLNGECKWPTHFCRKSFFRYPF